MRQTVRASAAAAAAARPENVNYVGRVSFIMKVALKCIYISRGGRCIYEKGKHTLYVYIYI